MIKTRKKTVVCVVYSNWVKYIIYIFVQEKSLFKARNDVTSCFLYDVLNAEISHCNKGNRSASYD